MVRFLSAIGLSGIIDKKIKFNRILKDASLAPDYNFKIRSGKSGRTKSESYKSLGDGFGVVVYAESYNKTNRKGETVSRMDINGWSLFARSDSSIEVEDFDVDADGDGWQYAFCQDKATGNLFEFKMNNMLEYEKRIKKGEHVTGANIAMLALFGTIILPVYKDDDTKNHRSEENRMQKELLEKARLGDNMAEEELNKKASEISQIVRERMKNEDILSIFEGYFMLTGNHSGSFSVLADIERVELLENSITNEKVVKLLLNIAGTGMNLFVNQKELVGMPMVGMRFMGMGRLQGSAVFE